MRMCRTGLLLVLPAFFLAAPAALAEEIVRELPRQIYGFEFNHNTILMCFVVAVVVCVAAWLCTRSLKEVPGKGQALFEKVFGAFDDLVSQSLGAESGRKYLPWIGSLFIFLWVSNMIGMLPIHEVHVGQESYTDYNQNGRFDPGEFDPEKHDADGDKVHDAGTMVVPAFEEPTSDYSVPLGMAILFVFIIGHGGHVVKHGVVGYIKSYFDPGGIMGVVMFPLNVVGKIAEMVSISFRLFGNIFGGVVILIVVGGLVGQLVLPIPMLGFFGVFVGTVQAFVFTMLALTYISLGVAEE